MAEPQQQQQQQQETLISTYIGTSFALFLSLFPTLHAANHHLHCQLLAAEDELAELRSRRHEDSKANARVVEIFATHRTAWQKEERRLLRRLDASEARVAELEAEVEVARREVADRDEMLNFMSKHHHHRSHSTSNGTGGGGGGGGGGDGGEDNDFVFGNLGSEFGYDEGYDGNFVSGSRFWNGSDPSSNPWHHQDVKYENLEPMHHVKHFVVRRESPWKLDGEATGVPSKLKLLEEELLNLEKVGKSNASKVALSMRKQAKRYQDLAGKIDDLCQRMQASDPSEPTLSSEFRSQRQTEFLLEAFQLQQRASETGKKLMTLQTEIYTCYIGDEMGPETKSMMKRSLDTIRGNFKEIQRNLEIWLARIMGDLEGILARDGASRVRERDYYLPRYPYVNSFN